MLKQVAIALTILSVPAAHAIQAETARAAAGCGDRRTSFKVRTDKKHHPTAQLTDGGALVYVFGPNSGEVEIAPPTSFRWGIDGAWQGAGTAKSYFWFTVAPGTHAVCAEAESRFQAAKELSAASEFKAQAGKTYYFRLMRRENDRHGNPDGLRLVALDAAEGNLLISKSYYSSSQKK